MRYTLAVFLGRVVWYISRIFHKGAGGTWPGEIALRVYPAILTKLSQKLIKGVILVAGTNGKTTTSLMIKGILEANGETVVHNASGANLINGVVSSLLVSSKKDWGLFEIDENVLPIICKSIDPNIIVLLNLFRDQLDRYGEIDTIATKWKKSLATLPPETTVIANADDPLVTVITESLQVKKVYIGLENPLLYRKTIQHATDTIYCPKCGTRLTYGGLYYSHLGKWSCGSCGFTHPDVLFSMKQYQSNLEGMYNHYNAIAAGAVGEVLQVNETSIKESLSRFVPAFGRMEHMIVRGKMVRIVLSKNPTGFNESLQTYIHSKHIGPLILLLNDRIPDGTDVSWIWDVDFEMLDATKKDLIVSGDRTYDMAVRLKYALPNMTRVTVSENLSKAVDVALAKTNSNETLWILATYSAMLDVRKLLTGKKIL